MARKKNIPEPESWTPKLHTCDMTLPELRVARRDAIDAFLMASGDIFDPQPIEFLDQEKDIEGPVMVSGWIFILRQHDLGDDEEITLLSRSSGLGASQVSGLLNAILAG